MTIKQIAEMLAIMDKMQIEHDPMLTKEEKEFWKQIVDEIKNRANCPNQK